MSIAVAMRAFAVIFAIAACGSGSRDPTPAEPVAADAPRVVDAPEPAAPARVAPHGGEIRMIAVADTGDAAFTADRFHQLRLWPSFDGKHEPVVVRGGEPTQLALAALADGWLAAWIDTAGGIELVRLAADGGQRGRSHVAPDPGFVQIVAVPGGVLAKRRDHHVVRFDAHGRALATLRLPAGDQIFALHARRTAAFAVIAAATRTILRRIDLAGDGARWGPTLELPVAVTSTFAISPSGDRAAGVIADGDGRIAIFDLAKATIVQEHRAGVPDPRFVAGFLDDNRAFVPHGVVVTVGAKSPTTTDVDRMTRPSAVGDNVVVTAAQTGLALFDGTTARYLGYQALGWDQLGRSATGFAHRIGNSGGADQYIWLDDQLRATRIANLVHSHAQIALDDRRVLLGVPDPLAPVRPVWSQHVEWLDVVTNVSKTLVEGCTQGKVGYDPVSRVVACPDTPKTRRYRLDIATGAVTKLASLQTTTDAEVTIFDPARAGGVVALALSSTPTRNYLEYFVEPDGDRRADPIESNVRFQIFGRDVGTDRAGRLYTVDDEGLLRIYQRNEATRTLPLGGRVTSVSIEPSGERIAVTTSSDLVVYDAAGTETWRTPIWNADRAVISPSGKTVALSTYGGLLAYAIADGKPVGSACAWGFGLRTVQTTGRAYHVPAVCE